MNDGHRATHRIDRRFAGDEYRSHAGAAVRLRCGRKAESVHLESPSIHRLWIRILSGALSRVMFAAILACSILPSSLHAQTGTPPIIAVASDLQFAMTDVAEAYRLETGQTVRLSFGSSGNFARQLRQGAPFELFLSADETYVDDLARDGVMRDGGVLYAIGRLALFVPKGSPVVADANLDDLAAALGDGRLKKFAIANPEHAPYGRRAEEALRHRGVWDAVKTRLVLGENVSQAAQFATSGNVEAGIISYAHVLSPKIASLGTFALIPEAWHAPIRQRMALTKTAGPVAQNFYAFTQTPAARTIFRKHGFALPGE